MKNTVTNLLGLMPLRFNNLIANYQISEIFIDEYNEVHISSNYEVDNSWVVAIEKAAIKLNKSLNK